MTYNPYKPRVIISPSWGGIYNVELVRKGKSPKVLASFPTKKQAEEYKRLRRP